MVSLTPIYETVENGWIQARIRELPEVLTVAPTQDEAQTMLRDALREYVDHLVEIGEPIPFRAERAEDLVLA
jgi:predicted RNase H-like HicB family nuclease